MRNGHESLNPYVIDDPIREDAQFFGREKELSWAIRVLGARATRRVIVIQGSFRIGKTSFLYQLRPGLPQKAFLVDLSAAEEGRPGYLLWLAATQIASDLRHETGRPFPDPEANAFLTDANYFHEVFLPTVYRALRRKRLVLAFDGLDVLEREEGWSSDAFYVYLGGLMKTGLNLSLVLAVEQWPEKTPWVFEDVHRVRLGALDDASATDLILEPAHGVLEFDYQAVRRIQELSSGHPYFVQLLGHTIFEHCAAKGRVTERDVEGAVPDVLELASPYMEHLWSGVSPKAKAVLAGLASLRGVRGIILEQDLGYLLRRRGAGLSSFEIGEACKELVDKDVLEGLGAMSYRCKVEVVRMWLGARRGLDTLSYVRGRSWVPATAGDWIGRFLWPLIGLLTVTAIVFWCLLSWLPLRGRDEASATPVQTEESTSLSYVLVTATPDLRTSPTPLSAPSPPTLDIAYKQWNEGTNSWDIHAMSVDGSVSKQVTNSDSDDDSPVWAADHSWMAFVSKRDGNQEIYRVDLDGSEPVNLTNNRAADWTPSISPDGANVVFSSLRDGNWELYMMDADGSQPARMTFNQEPDYAPAWSPDGSKIAFVSERDGNLEIYVMNADGSEESRLTFNNDLDLSPAWAPNGALIAFESYRDDDMEIYIMNADGSEQRNLTNRLTADDHGPSWSNDGFSIVFYSNRDGNWDLYLMNAQGGDVRNVTDSPGAEQEPFWGF